MADIPIDRTTLPTIPLPPADEENEAIQDAHKVFLITFASAVAFVAFGVLVLVITRWG